MKHRTVGGTYPQMARELAKIIACAEFSRTGAGELPMPELAREVVYDAVSQALSTHTMGTHQSVTLEALSSLMLVTLTADNADEESLSMVRDGTFFRRLLAVWEEAQPVGTTIDLSVSILSQTGWNALGLSWAVITFETHKHVNLVWHQANKLEKTFPDREASDLFGWGWMGLRAALRLYDPALGFAFSTYACTRITGSIRDGVRSENPVPKRLATYARKVVKAESDLAQSLGRVPTLEEVANAMGAELDSLRIMPRLNPAASIDEILDVSSERGGAPKWLVDNQDPAELTLDLARADAVSIALSALPEDQRAAVQLLVMDSMSPTQARTLTGATARQMRQRKEKALLALKESLLEWAE